MNLFVRVLIKTILNEKKVMLVLINNDARSFYLKKIFLQYKMNAYFLKFKILKNIWFFNEKNLLINDDNFMFKKFFQYKNFSFLKRYQYFNFNSKIAPAKWRETATPSKKFLPHDFVINWCICSSLQFIIKVFYIYSIDL